MRPAKTERAEGEHLSGSPANAPRWLRINDAAAYMGGVSRNTVYAAVAAGMRVSRLVDEARAHDSVGRRNHGRMWFYTPWIDEFLQARASGAPLCERDADTGKSLILQHEDDQRLAEIATPLQRTTGMVVVRGRSR